MAQLEHPRYKLVPKEEAQAIAWVFNGPFQQPVEYPFVFPELQPDEIRIKQSYFGICYTDCISQHLLLIIQITLQIPVGLSVGILFVQDMRFQVELLLKEKMYINFKLDNLWDMGIFVAIVENAVEYYLCHNGNIDQLCLNQGDEHLIPYPQFGGFATHVQAPARWAIPIPLSIPEHLCPPLLCAGITVYAPLKRFFGAQKQCAVAGIGGLGHLAIKFSDKLGMQTTAISTSDDKREDALSYGAVDFINSNNKEDLKKNAWRFDLMLVTANAGTSAQLQEYINLLKPNSEIVLLGIPEKEVDLYIPFSVLLDKQVRIVGSLVGSRQENYEMIEFAAKHKIYPECEEFEFQDFKMAYNYLYKGKPKYRCVVKIGNAGDLKE